jgi:hypothetical protein
MQKIELEKLKKHIEKLNKSDLMIILNIISRLEDYKAPLITEIKNGTYINISKLSENTIKNLNYFLKIKQENDDINKMKNKN